MNRRTPRRMTTMDKPKIRGGKMTTPIVNRHNGRFGGAVRRPQSKEAFYCNNRNMEQCRQYLLQATNNNQAVHDLFNLLDTNSKYNSVKNGQVKIEDLMNNDHSIHGDSIFCGGSECGNFYGIGGCSGGQACCGFGGLGIGCNYKFKDKHGSTH